MKRKIFVLLSLFLITINGYYHNAIAIDLNNIIKSTANTQDLSKMLENAVQVAVKSGTDELNKNVKVIVSDVKKEINSVVVEATKEIQKVENTIDGVKNTVYSVKSSFDKIITLLKILIAMTGVLITILSFMFLNKILQILKIFKAISNLTNKKEVK